MLEKAIRANATSLDQKKVVEYMKLLLNRDLIQWMSGVESRDPERLRGEAAILKDLIQILSDTQFELDEGDANDRRN